jgi:2'-5' RNA ligase
VSTKLQEALSAVAPFLVTADHFYNNKGSKYVELGFLDPKPILRLRDSVQKALALPSVEGYEPHVTVGQCDQREISAFVTQLQTQWQPLSWMVTEVCLLHKEGKRYKPIARIPLLGDDGNRHGDGGGW